MDARVIEILGDGTMTDQLLNATINDTLTVTRGVATANPPTIRFQFDDSISPDTLDVTIPAGRTTVLEQQETIYTALGGVSGLTRIQAVAEVAEDINGVFIGSGAGENSNYWLTDIAARQTCLLYTSPSPRDS